jgi:hypothetical protein
LDYFLKRELSSWLSIRQRCDIRTQTRRQKTDFLSGAAWHRSVTLDRHQKTLQRALVESHAPK